MEKKSVFIVDDNKSFMESAVKFLATDDHFSVVGWAFNAEQAIQKIKKFSPDLVLLDFSLPDMNGFQATRILKQFDNPPKIIIISINNYENYSSEAGNCGADAYICKSEFGSSIIPLIESLFDN